MLVIAFDENLRDYPNAKDYFSAELLLSAGLKGIVAWIAIFAVIPLVSGITVALLSPRAEYFNAAFPILFLITGALACASTIANPTIGSWASWAGSYLVGIIVVAAGAYWVRRRRSARLRA